MSSIQNFVYSGLSSLFFSKQFNSKKHDISEIVLEDFKKNYIQETCKFFSIRSAFYLSGITSVGYSVNYGITSTATIASLVAFGILAYAWNKGTDKPYDLALCAYRFMSQRNESMALEAIKAGANIYQDFSHLSIKGNVNPNLFMQAAEYGCTEVIKFLASLGWDLNENASAIGRAPNLETVQLLVELGANVNLYNGQQFSPLWIQLTRLSSYLEKKHDSELVCLDTIEKKCRLIEFLLDQGAKLQNEPLRFNEKNRALKEFKENLEKIDALLGYDLKSKEEVKNLINKIYNRL